MEINADSKDSIKRAITEAAVENYELLLESREINKRLDTFSSEAIVKSNLLHETLSKLQFHSQKIADVGASWRAEKQVLSNAMSNYPQLLAIAEAPSLLRDCLRNDMYSQALLIIENMSRITPREANSDNLFTRIQLQLWETLDACFDEVILPRLSESLTANVTFRLIIFLKHLGIDKSCVQELFLERRTMYLDRLMQEAEQNPIPFTRAIKLITIYKNQTLEVLTQYELCFLPSERKKEVDENDSESEEGWNQNIQAWCYAQAERFLAAFARCVGLLTNGSELAFLLEKSSNCSTSAARVHMDLSPAMDALLLRRIKALLSAHMAHAVAAYASSMRGFSWRKASTLRAPGTSRVKAGALAGGGAVAHSTPPPTPSTPVTTPTPTIPSIPPTPTIATIPISTTSIPTPTPTLPTPRVTPQEDATMAADAGVTGAPPAILAQCLPLACAVNGLLTAFNFCRRLMMSGLELEAAEGVVGLLARIAGDLARDADVVETLTALEQGSYYNFVRIFVDVLYPYVLGCTAKLFTEGSRRWVEESMNGEVEALARRLPREGPATEPVKILPSDQPS